MSEAVDIGQKTKRMSRVDKAAGTWRWYSKKARKQVEDLDRKIEKTPAEQIFIGQQAALLQAGDEMVKYITGSMNAALGKLPPQSTMHEEQVLGAIMLFKDAGPAVTRFLMVDHFYTEANKLIYQACKALMDQGIIPALPEVATELRRSGHLELIGGGERLFDLVDKVVRMENVEMHSRLLIEYAIKRRLIEVCGRILHDAYDDATDCFELKETAENEFKALNEWIK